MTANDSAAPPDAGARFATRRLVRRYPLDAAADILEPIARARFSARTSHISMSGCFVEIPEPPPVNTVIQIRIKQGKETFETWARVASIRAGPKIEGWQPEGSAMEAPGMGVAFFQADPDQEVILARWLEHLQSDVRAL
jgi:hypothetical protein